MLISSRAGLIPARASYVIFMSKYLFTINHLSSCSDDRCGDICPYIRSSKANAAATYLIILSSSVTTRISSDLYIMKSLLSFCISLRYTVLIYQRQLASDKRSYFTSLGTFMRIQILNHEIYYKCANQYKNNGKL